MSNKLEGLLIYLRSTGNQDVKQALFTKIWQDYYSRIWLFSKSILKNKKTIIADVVQEIMLKVFNNLEKYNPLHSFSTWIFTIARNTCLDWNKRRVIKTVVLDENTLKGRNDSPEQIMLKRDIGLRIEKYIQKLPEVESQIAYMRFFENLKIKEISSVMKMPQGTIKFKIHTIKKNLKNLLAEEDYVN